MKIVRHLIGLVVLMVAGGAAQATTEWNAADYDLYAGDFNGDGKADILYIAKDPSMPSGIALSDGTGPNIAWQSWASNFLGINWSANTYNVIVGDFNGDGKADIFLQSVAPGNNYLLLTSSTGYVVGISQTVSNSAMGLTWSADQHHIIAGAFAGSVNGHPKAGLFLQATSSTGTDAVVLSDANGMFSSTSPSQTWTDGYLGFQWNTNKANVYAGDFNGDGLADLLIQAKPNFVEINFSVPFPVPTYPPNMNGVVLASATAPIFAAAGVQAWSRMSNGVDWSPLTNTIIVGANGTGPESIILQGRYSGRTSYELTGNTTGAIFAATATALSSNVSMTSDLTHLIGGNFAGGNGFGVYYQSLTLGGTNYVSTSIGATTTASVQNLPSTTLIQAPTAAGRTTGVFGVSATGASTYSVPLVTPPGVGSVQLQLALQYNSRSPNGIMGVGWSIAGLSSITRCAKTYAQDGAPGPVTLQLSSTYSDRFCLDGRQLKLTSSSVAYGYGGSSYATEIETFSKIVASTAMAGNGPASFQVTTKNGLIYTYGGTTDSEVFAGTSGTVRTWALSQISDRSGNTIALSYQQSNGSYRIDHILYPMTANGTGPFYELLFQYGLRPSTDVPSGYIAGYPSSEPNQLNNIQSIDYASGSLIKQYNLAYTQSATTNRETLTAIQECSAATCLAPTKIGYQAGSAGWASTPNLGFESLNVGPWIGDFNGDGRTDILYAVQTSTSQSGSCVTRTYELWAMFGSGSGTNFTTGVDTGNHFSENDLSSCPAGYVAGPIVGKILGKRQEQVLIPNGTSWTALDFNGTTFSKIPTGVTINAEFMLADVDGDGLDDLISWPGTTLQVRRNITAPGGALTYAGTPQTIYSGTPNWASSFGSPLSTVKVADFNGDGRADLIACPTSVAGTNQVSCVPLLSNGANASGQIQPFTPTTGATGNWGNVAQLLDWNGDGCTDISVENTLYVSNCAGGFATYALPSAVTCQLVNAHVGSQCPVAIDWDGDGRSDILYYHISDLTWHVLRSNGADPSNATDLPAGLNYGGKLNYFAMDIWGDGRQDLVGAGTSFAGVWYQHNGTATPPDLATSFTDGFGMSQSPTYVPLTNSTYYSEYSTATFPEEDFVGALYVVNNYSASDGTGGVYNATYTYFGGRLHAQGRGFEGFDYINTLDSRIGFKTAEYYQQLFPYTGMTYHKIVPASAHNLSEWKATPNAQTIAGLGGHESRVFTYLSPETTTLWEYGGAKDGSQIQQTVTTTAYADGYGNPTQVITSTTDTDTSAPASPFNGTTWTRTTNVSYYNDTTHNCLGLPDTLTIQSAVPGQAAQTRTYSYLADTTFCRTTQQTIEPNTAALSVITVYGFDTCGNTDSVSVTGHNPDGSAMATRTTGYNYSYFTSRCQKLEQITNALGQSAYFQYNYDFGVPISITDPNTLVTTSYQDDYGREIKTVNPDGTYSTMSYSSCSTGPCWGLSDLRFQSIFTEYGSDGSFINQRDQYFDGYTRIREEESYRANGLGNAAVWTINAVHTYDSLGRQTQLANPYSTASNGYTTWQYDLLNRVTSINLYQANGTLDRTTSIQYLGRTVQVTDPLLNKVSRVSDVTGRLRQVIDPAPGGTIKYSYDAFGNLNQTIDAIGATSGATFNLRGFRTQMVDADAGTWNFSGDSLNETVAWTDAKAQSFSALYDLLGRMYQRTEPEGTSTWSWGASSSLHNVGQLAGESGYGYSESRTYDTVGRINTVVFSTDQSYTYSYGYNAIGALGSVTYPTSPATTGTTAANLKIQYAYVAGEPVQILDVSNSSPTPLWTSLSNTDAGLSATEMLGTGTSGVSVATTYKSWTNEVLSIQAGSGGSATNIQNLGYLWDTAGNLSQRGDANQSGNCVVNGSSSKLCEVFTPDTLNRLSSSTLNGVSNLAVTYDASGDILTRSDVGSYSYPLPTAARPHAATMAGSNSYTFDANGNVATKNGLAVTWASYNLPTKLQSTASGSALQSQFLYGPDHQRYQQIATYSDGTETTQYIGGALEKMTASLTGLIYWRHYLKTPSGHTIVISRNSDGSISKNFVLNDHIGSSDAIVNGLTGALNIQESFSAFGLRRQSNWTAGVPTAWTKTAVTEGTRHGFTGHEELDGVGLVHMNGRVYDPAIGRFLSVDPISDKFESSQAANPYSYVENRPLVATDPTGLEEKTSNTDSSSINIPVPAPPSPFANIPRPMISDLSGGGTASSPPGQGQCTPDTQFQNGGSAQEGPGSAPSPGPASPGSSSPESSPPGSSLPGGGQSPHAPGPSGQPQSGTNIFAAVQVNWHSGAYVPGVFGRVNFNLGPASFTVNGALNLVNSVGNIFADGIGALTSPFDTYQGELLSTETGLGPGSSIAMAGTLALARVSSEIRAANALAPSSRVLGRALEASGIARPSEAAAHHIVAGSAQGAAAARATLRRLGIGINDAANGVFLRGADHAGVHTTEYYNAVNHALSGVTTRAEAERILQRIAGGLQNGTFP